MLRTKTILILLLWTCSALVFAQEKDSLIFNNDHFLVGEIKKMSQGVIEIETEYSDEDFKAEWSSVKKVYSETFFLISLSDGRRFNGDLQSIEGGKVEIVTGTGDIIICKIEDIIMLESIDKGFWSRMYAQIDVGLDLTKANNLKQLSARSQLGYMADRWSLEGNYNTLYSSQDSTDAVERNDGTIDYKFYFKKSWFSTLKGTLLSNTEQKLKLRSTLNLGLGYYIIYNSHVYWATTSGVAYNNENYYEPASSRNSYEAFLGTELNFYATGDLDLYTQITIMPSITEPGRWRSDLNVNFKYDLPLDLYVTTGFTYNYDNQPVDGAAEYDYVVNMGVGWEW